MITVGVDAHKQVHVAVAVDDRGRQVDRWEGANSVDGRGELAEWAGRWAERRWGIEGSGGYGLALARDLVSLGETVYEVNPRLTAQSRRRARRRDKSDRLDAEAVARVVQREESDLPRVTELDEDAEALDVLNRERARVKSQVDRLRNQLHNRLFRVDPEYRASIPSLSGLEAVRRLEQYELTEGLSRSAPMRALARSVQMIASALRLMMEQLAELTREIEGLAKARFPALATIRGAALLTAGALAGILGTRTFRSADRLATYGGVAPLETSSAGHVRHRLNRNGNRRLNSVLHRIVLTQWRCGGEGRAYIERRMSEGKTWREGVRALKRHVARAVWCIWQEHYAPRPPLRNPQNALN